MGLSGGSGITFRVTEVLTGLSSAAKPTLGAGAAAIFVETDTGLEFYWDGTLWVPLNRKEYRSVTDATATLGADETIVGVNRAGVVTITLPTAQAALAGRPYVVKDESGAAATNNITVDTQGAELIDGAATDTINTNFASIGYYTNGTDWFKI
jgi:hypothetical protein